MNRLEETLFGVPTARGEGRPGAWTPPVDIYETENEIVVTAELPGVKQEEISIELEGNALTISGERKQEPARAGENYHRVERVYGRFQRSFTLDIPVDQGKVTATYKQGILAIHLPKAEEAKPRQIKVRVE